MTIDAAPLAERITRTVSAALDRAVSRQPHSTALRYYGASWTYAELADEVVAVAAGLKELGLGPGDRLAIFAHNVPEVVVTFLAAGRLGAIAVGVNPQLTAAEASYIVEDSGAKLLLATADTLDPAVQLGPTDVEHIVLVDRSSATQRDRRQRMASVAESGSALQSVGARVIGYDTVRDTRGGVDDHAAPETPLVIFYTSGTTGRPKGAVWSHRGFLYGCVAPWTVIPSQAARATLKATNLMAVGLGATCLGPMLLGCEVHLLERVSPDEILRCVLANEVSFIATVPSVLRLVFARMREQAVPALTSLLAIQLGGSPPNDELFADITTQCPRAEVFHSYAASEGWVSMTPAGTPAGLIGSVGRALPGTEVAILDDDGQPVAPGERGRIGFRGPGTMLGYWRNEAATARARIGSYLTAGDVGHLDRGGLLRIDGRDSDVIISGGYNVYASEVEGVLLDVPGVRQAAVLSRPDPVLGERVVAYVVATGLPPDVLAAATASRLARYKRPREWVMVDSLPTNALGKVQKHLIAPP